MGVEDQHDEIEFEQPLEEDVETVNEGKRIFKDISDPEITALLERYDEGDLVINPDFQRNYVWDGKKASRLIESALLEIPIPNIYLSEQKDGTVHVIDGQQRLTAFFSFIRGQFPDGGEFKLTGLTSFRDLEGKKYKELGKEVQNKIKRCTLHTITFKKESDPNLKFEIFERLNTGAQSLNDQELRNCIYRGEYNKLLIELSRDRDFMALLGLEKPEKRMRDIELVLRFAAFYHSTYLNYKPPMKKFLNEDMEKNQNMQEGGREELRIAFRNTVSIIKSLLGSHAFKRFYGGSENVKDGRWEAKRFNASLYDILMFTFAKADKNKVFQNLEVIREALIDLMVTDQEFIDSIELSTSSIKAIKTRFDKWRQRVDGVLETTRKEPRCFTRELKQKMYQDNPTCGICNQKIEGVDDAALDHIKQYWMGGKTVPENARLTHRYCNEARSRKT